MRKKAIDLRNKILLWKAVVEIELRSGAEARSKPWGVIFRTQHNSVTIDKAFTWRDISKKEVEEIVEEIILDKESYMHL